MTSAVSRRWMIGSTGAVGLAAALAACSGSDDGSWSGGGNENLTATTLGLPAEAAQLGAGSFQLFAANDMNFQTLIALGAARYAGQVGEVVTVVDQANAADGGATYQSLYDAMVAMGNVLEERATAAANAGHQVTARNQFLRAAQYYNQALYWVLGTDTPGAEAEVYRTMDAAFIQAAQRMDPEWEKVSIPYEDDALNGWFLKPVGASGRLPTIIMNNGSDGQNVDFVGQGGVEGIDRGYAVLIFEGPGQGNQLFLNNVVFRPDWQNVITPVVDYLHTRDDVDTDKIAARGISFGGLLIPQAAAFEKRLAAIIADPGFVQAWSSYPSVITDLAKGSPEEVNEAWAGIQGVLTPTESFTLKKRLEIYTPEGHTQATQGQVPSDWYAVSRAIQAFDVTETAPEVTAPTLVLSYQGDDLFFNGAKQLYDVLRTERKDLVEMTVAEGAQYHCGPMNPQLVSETIYDWLDDVFDR